MFKLLIINVFLLMSFIMSSCAQTEEYIETCENTKCTENAECKMIDELPNCVCKEGFEGNGLICNKKENFLWKKTVGGDKYDYGISITHDKENNIYIAGYFKGSVDFDFSDGKDVHTSGYVCKKKTGECEPSCSKENEVCDYDTLECKCKIGYHYKEFEDADGNLTTSCVLDICERECSNNEICSNNECICKEGYHKAGYFGCVLDFGCNNSCAENEVCNNGICVCKDNYNQIYANNSFVTKIKDDGTYLWTKTIFSINDNKAIDLKVKDDKVFLLGTFKGDVDFNPSSGSDIKAGREDMDKTFLLQLTNSGSYINTMVLDAHDPTSMEINNNALYITGSFIGEVDFDPDYTANVFESTNYSNDIFITKFKTDNSYLWTKVIGGNDWDGAQAVVTDSKGDIYIVGGFNSTVDFNPTDGIDEHTSNGSTDLFITKFSFSGIYQWTKTLGSSNYDMIEDVIVDSDDNILVVGSFSDVLAISDTEGYDSNGDADIFVSKLDKNGNFLWTKVFGGPSWETYGSISVDSEDNVYVVADFVQYIKFDDDIQRDSLGGNDIFMVKLDKSGKFLLGKTIGGSDDEYGAAIDIDNNDNLLITGSFTGNIIMESTTDSFTSQGGNDIFIFKIK